MDITPTSQADPIPAIAPTHAKLFAALAKAQKDFKPIPRNREVEVKTKTGDKYRFRYATLDAVIDATRDALASNGLAQTCLVCKGAITVTLAHESGESVSSSLPLPDPASGWQVFGSALTYARRYLWAPMIGVAAEDDDDGNGADGNSITDPLEELWSAVDGMPNGPKGAEAIRLWIEAALGRPIATPSAIKETEVPLLLGIAKGRLPMPSPKANHPKPEAKPHTDATEAIAAAKLLNAALDALKPWGNKADGMSAASAAAMVKAEKLAWVNAMIAPATPVKTVAGLTNDIILALAAKAEAGEMPAGNPDDEAPDWMNTP